MESLEAVQAQVVFILVLSVTILLLSRLTQVLNHSIVPLPFSNYYEQIGHSPSVIELGLSENVELLFPSSYCQDIHSNVIVPFEDTDLVEEEWKS